LQREAVATVEYQEIDPPKERSTAADFLSQAMSQQWTFCRIITSVQNTYNFFVGI
jgi:hypothetical protein